MSLLKTVKNPYYQYSRDIASVKDVKTQNACVSPLSGKWAIFVF